MDLRKKLFVNKHLADVEVMFVKSVLDQMDIEEYLSEGFMYVDLNEFGDLEIITVKDEYVYLCSAELNVDNKMAMQFFKNRNEIENKTNELLYWCGINNLKKYIPVVSDENGNKKYAEMTVFAKGIPEAVRYLHEIYYDDYIYLEDVDEEV